MKKRGLVIGAAVTCVILILTTTLAPASPKPHEKVLIEILGAGKGSSGWALAYALADLINKYGPTWLNATATETRGCIDNALSTYKDPTKRANVVLYMDRYGMDAARLGRTEFKFPEPLPRQRAVGFAFMCTWFFATLDPGIRTEIELDGKKVATDRVGASKRHFFLDYWGQAPYSVKEVTISLNEGKDALIAGTVDALMMLAMYTGNAPSVFAPHVDLLARKKEKVHFISMNPEIIKKAAEATGMAYYYAEYPPKAFRPWHDKPLGGINNTLMWTVWPDFPDDVAYEIAKVIYEHANDFASYHANGRGINKETVSWLDITGLDEVQPGALKFYQEKGLKLGRPAKLPMAAK